MNITNTHKSTVLLPTGQALPSNVATPVHDWDKVSKNNVVKAWLRAGTLVESGEPVTASTDEKEDLIARLADLGVKADKRKTVEKLQEMLAKTEADALADSLKSMDAAIEASGLSAEDWAAQSEEDKASQLADAEAQLQESQG